MGSPEPPALSFSTKEMLIRLEGKVDALLISQSDLSGRLLGVEKDVANLKDRFEGHAASAGHEVVRAQISAVNRRLAYASGFFAACMVGVETLARFT